MLAILTASALLAELAVASVPGPDIVIEEQVPAAYQELSQGHTSQAVTSLETQLATDPNEPALLINLGYAYARLGKVEKAIAAYHAAIDSSTRYELETADGRWLDSRRVAQTALQSLQHSTQLASLGD